MIAQRTWRLAAACYGILVLVVSVIPVPAQAAPGRLDKVLHLCEYLLLAWLLVQAFQSVEKTRRFWAAWFFATLYGAAIEAVQFFVPWRSADWIDGLMNAAGAALGVCAALWIPKGHHQ